MPYILSLMLIMWMGLFSLATRLFGLHVTEDFERAKELARAYQKPLVLAFVGTDWAPPIDIGSFEEGLSNQCILVKVDFPELNSQPSARIEQNHQLKEQFGVTRFPTLLVLTPQGEEISRLGDVGATKLLEVLKGYHEVALGMELGGNTKALYVKAKALGSQAQTEALLRRGLAEGERYFLMERFAQMVKEGKGGSKEALALKRKLLSSDPENGAGIHLRCAMLEFQGREEGSEPLVAVQPLLEYIAGIGKEDKELWRVQLLISEFLMKHQLKPKAIEFAQRSLSGAPVEMQADIRAFIGSNAPSEGRLSESHEETATEY